MSEKHQNDGGPAFPRPHIEAEGQVGSMDPQIGMTLRDYFAAEALPAVITTGTDLTREQACKLLGIAMDKYDPGIHWPMICAREAYAIADAMLVERDRT